MRLDRIKFDFSIYNFVFNNSCSKTLDSFSSGIFILNVSTMLFFSSNSCFSFLPHLLNIFFGLPEDTCLLHCILQEKAPLQISMA